MIRTVSLAGILGLAAFPAAADVCVYSPKAASEQALRLLRKGDVIMEFCYPCKETMAKAVTVQTETSERETDPDPGQEPQYLTKVNGEELDLAYTFVRGGANKMEWINLGLQVNCTNDRSLIELKSLPAQYVPGQ